MSTEHASSTNSSIEEQARSAVSGMNKSLEKTMLHGTAIRKTEGIKVLVLCRQVLVCLWKADENFFDESSRLGVRLLLLGGKIQRIHFDIPFERQIQNGIK